VGERRVAEAAVPPARAERDSLAFEEENRALRVGPERFDGRPETGEPSADDGEIAFDLPFERIARGRPVGRGEPEGLMLGVGERGV
jgi:hypothetical protein